ncbi:sulfate/molybdate ABC transporter ATP-binding protein [Nocardia sp. NPDC051570]|uniref:sulfate/molybdate ABC transporter ATP-binding protein n=1 Tax=Nocardia sp. NPDC051570 TaxID=3364324 RepID=UPI0037B4C710
MALGWFGTAGAGVNDPAGLQVSVRLTERDVDIELAVAPGEVLALLGPNGAGKSTVLELVAGLIRPDEGRIRLGDRMLIDRARGIEVPPHRRGVAMLAQDALLFPHLSVAANVAFGPRSRGMGRRAAGDIAREWLRAVDALALRDRRPGELSGGQAQRVALARALAVDPELILLDEPMAALDVATAPAMRTLLRRVLRDPERNSKGPSAILVTHDIVDALTLADRVVVLEAGRIAEQGPVTTVLSRPRSAFAARIAGVNLLIGHVADAGIAGRRLDPVADASTAGRRLDHVADASTGGRQLDPVADAGIAGRRLDHVADAGTAGGQLDHAADASTAGRRLDMPGSGHAAEAADGSGGAAQRDPADFGTVRCGADLVYGRRVGDWAEGGRAAAVFSPAAVAVHRDRPTGSPRNVFRVEIAELTDRGGSIRVHAVDRPDGGAGIVADLTPSAVAELGLTPGLPVYFAVKATEVQVYPC